MTDADISIELLGLGTRLRGNRAELHVPVGHRHGHRRCSGTGGFNQFIINAQVGVPGSTYNVAPVDGTPMTFRFYSPNDPAHKADGFVEIAVADRLRPELQVSNTGGLDVMPGGSSGLTARCS